MRVLVLGNGGRPAINEGIPIMARLDVEDGAAVIDEGDRILDGLGPFRVQGDVPGNRVAIEDPMVAVNVDPVEEVIAVP